MKLTSTLAKKINYIYKASEVEKAKEQHEVQKLHNVREARLYHDTRTYEEDLLHGKPEGTKGRTFSKSNIVRQIAKANFVVQSSEAKLSANIAGSLSSIRNKANQGLKNLVNYKPKHSYALASYKQTMRKRQIISHMADSNKYNFNEYDLKGFDKALNAYQKLNGDFMNRHHGKNIPEGKLSSELISSYDFSPLDADNKAGLISNIGGNKNGLSKFKKVTQAAKTSHQKANESKKRIPLFIQHQASRPNQVNHKKIQPSYSFKSTVFKPKQPSKAQILKHRLNQGLSRN